MNTNTIINLGDKAQIKVLQNWYGTVVERLGDASVFYISLPQSKHMPFTLTPGQAYILHTVNNKGLFEFDVCVLEIERSDNVPMAKLQIVSEPRRHQRRNAFRVAIILDVKIRESSDPEISEGSELEYQTKTLDLSESGMLFLARKNYPEGAVLSCDIMLSKFGTDETLEDIKVEVIRSNYPKIGGVLHQIGVDFKEISKQDRRVLTKFIMLTQREHRQRQNIRDYLV